MWNGRNPKITQNVRGKQLILDMLKLSWEKTMRPGNEHDVCVTKMAETLQG